MPDWIKDLLKQGLSSLFTAAFPSVTNPKLFQLPFINPQVPADLWLITAFLTFVASFLTYGLALPNKAPAGAAAGSPAPAASPLSIFLAVGGLVLALLALVAILFITQKLVTIDPGWESLLNRIAFVLLFVGMGPPLGWGLGRTIA